MDDYLKVYINLVLTYLQSTKIIKEDLKWQILNMKL